MRFTAQDDGFADDFKVTPEASRPNSAAENGHLRALEAILVRVKDPSAEHWRSEKPEETLTHARNGNQFRVIASREIDQVKTIRRDVLNKARLLTPQIEFWKTSGALRYALVGAHDLDNTVHLRSPQGLQ
jgi:hypothetical protein